jgi:hypothetical protein
MSEKRRKDTDDGTLIFVVWHGKAQTPKTKNAIKNIPIPTEIVDAVREHSGGRYRAADAVAVAEERRVA